MAKVLSPEELERRWAQRSLEARNGLSQWETESQDVQRTSEWGRSFASGAGRSFGVSVGPKSVERYVEQVTKAGAGRLYSDGVQQAAREGSWKKNTRAGLSK